MPVPPSPVPFTVPSGQQAIWWDEFSGSSLDTAWWQYDLGTGANGWGNSEQQSYTSSPANVGVADGKLYINAVKVGGWEGGRCGWAKVSVQRCRGLQCALPPPQMNRTPASRLLPSGNPFPGRQQ